MSASRILGSPLMGLSPATAPATTSATPSRDQGVARWASAVFAASPAASSAPTLTGLPYYSRCALAGGMCASGTHLILVPLDVVKTLLQLDPIKYPSVGVAGRTLVAEHGVKALFRGLSPTFGGYLMQGAAKFGFFEFFRDEINKTVGYETAANNKMLIYATASGAAEVIGSTLLVPWEALRIRMVNSPEYANLGVPSGMKRMLSEVGIGGVYRGLVPILFKQLPYTITQLSVFSMLLQYVYGTVLPDRFGLQKSDLSNAQQLGLSVCCGIVAGVASSIASHPGDTVLTVINKAAKAAAAGKAVKPPTPLAVLRQLGFGGLWVGVGTRCVFTGVLSAGMFLIYDSVRLAVGLPASGKK